MCFGKLGLLELSFSLGSTSGIVEPSSPFLTSVFGAKWIEQEDQQTLEGDDKDEGELTGYADGWWQATGPEHSKHPTNSKHDG